VLLVCTTFPLIWIGGLVTTYKAGMAVPDWPNTYGYNLFLYPWKTWLNGPWDLFIEHGHRLWGAAVGMVTIALVVSVWLHDDRRWLRACSFAALAAVIFQGLLGGLRVRIDEILLARVHGCFGPAFFAFATALAVFTSRWWREAQAASSANAAAGSVIASGLAVSGGLARLAGVTALLAYVQVVLGSLLRHVPAGTGPAAFRTAVWAHLLMAAVVSIHILLLAAKTWRLQVGDGALVRPVFALVGLLIAQLSLGASTWVVKYGWPAWFADSSFAPGGGLLGFTVAAGSRLQAWITTLHVAFGSLILATAVMTAVRMARAACRTGVAVSAVTSQPRLNSSPRLDSPPGLDSQPGGERPQARQQVLEAVA
jgi:cytochrome c oxidase assembly protein subunit 15